METFAAVIEWMENLIWNTPEAMPAMVVVLLGFGIFITIRLMFVQLTQFKHGFKVLTGAYDDPSEKGDINHFQALSTALSATVGIGNIAGVALAIHFGGPGALFWMWVTAVFGMAIKFTECTLGAYYRITNEDGSVSGGPMYYIERGLGPNWKPLAVLFAVSAAICAFLTGNAVQANTVADVMQSSLEIPVAVTGLFTASIVAAVILGGIKRIGYVTARLVPFMAVLYVLAGLLILLFNYDQVLPGLATIFSMAFSPEAGALGVGSGALIFTLSYGVQRGLFSNEAGQGSSPIAMSASRTDKPVRSGLVGLIGPFIDTIIVCSITGLVIIVTGAWDQYHQTSVNPESGDVEYVITEPLQENGQEREDILQFEDGVAVNGEMKRFEIPVDTMYTDEEFSQPFNGTIQINDDIIVQDQDGQPLNRLYGGVVENGAPLTAAAFNIGLEPLFPGAGQGLVTLAVFLFAISTSISWSYYGDRSFQYLAGTKSVFYYRLVFVLMHFLGAIVALTTVWQFGDVMLGTMALFNIIGLIFLSNRIYEIYNKYRSDKTNY